MSNSPNLRLVHGAALNIRDAIEPDVIKSINKVFGAAVGQPPSPALQSGGDGGNSGGMEARIASVEAHMEHVRSDVGDIKTTIEVVRTNSEQSKTILSGLVASVAALPDKDYVGTTMRNWVIVIGIAVAMANGLVQIASRLH